MESVVGYLLNQALFVVHPVQNISNSLTSNSLTNFYVSKWVYKLITMDGT
jgi:hypothetical protein